MRVAIIGTYPPVRCGIATFTADVEHALQSNGVEVTVVPVGLVEPRSGVSIQRNHRPSYIAAAEQINAMGCDIVLVQHEFGIFGGVAGSYLLSLTDSLTVPYAVTLHTVLPQFSPDELSALTALCVNAAVVTVFTARARRLLLRQDVAAARSVQVVPHGAPSELYKSVDKAAVRQRIGLPAVGPVLSTFGLLSEGKGIDLAIRALGRLVPQHPSIRYVIAGRTHPEIVRNEGERYRNTLMQLVEELKLQENVIFINEFLGVDQVAELLAVTDVFCTPYRGEDQIVSGALTFALAACCPVVSTPYVYAQDVLADGAGLLTRPGDVASFADALGRLVVDGPERAFAVSAAIDASKSLAWPSVGKTIRTVLSNAIGSSAAAPARRVLASKVDLNQTVRVDHLRVLCDDTAMLQHAALKIPRAEDGYCVDDAGRVLPILADLAVTDPDPQWNVQIARLLTFLRSAIDPSGNMRNFMSWNRTWLDEPHSGDHVGRAMWGLGDLVARRGPFTDEATDLLVRLAPSVDSDAFPRTLAYSALGLCASGTVQHSALGRALDRIVDAVQNWLPLDQAAWCWPEARLSYDNARIPETLIRVGAAVGDEAMIDRGIDMVRWFDSLCLRGDHYRFPGHLGLGPNQDPERSGDEQPLEACALADAHAAIWELRGGPTHVAAIERAWSWFLGNNRLELPVGLPEFGASRDGLCTRGLNGNCGAESTIAFHRCASTRLAVTRMATLQTSAQRVLRS